MEEILKSLYHLQLIDNHLDELEDLKGDLPEVVATLESQIEKLDQTLTEKKDLIAASKASRDKADVHILEFKEKLERYKKQQYEVRSNKEYDAITREIDFAEESIVNLQKEFQELEGTMNVAKTDIDTISVQKEELVKQLEENREELSEVTKANEEEELKLRHERDKIVVRIKKETVTKYERIRKARGGKGVVTVRKNSCGGCHNAIPPQRLLELRASTKMFVCERCGRILVSSELAENVKANR